jgi:hypothetical protein
MKAAVILILGTALAMKTFGADNQVKEEMRLKLFFAQGVLEGIATENFPLIATNANKLKHFSQSRAWDVRQAPEYRRLTTDFQRSADNLARAATQRNVDAATVAYFQLTTSCVTCHKYLRGAEVSGLTLPRRAEERSEATTTEQKMVRISQ